jgi:hypothetical protein
MAKSRYSRAGTTVNINTHATRRAATRRAAKKIPARAGTTRTLQQVYRGPSKSESNTGLIVGGVALAALGAVLLWPTTASAATTPGAPGAPGGPGGQGGGGGGGGAAIPNTVPTNPAFPPIPGASGGYSGPGGYRTTAPSGLRIRSAPNTQGTDFGLQPIGTPVTVVGDAGNGWFQVSSPRAGFMCASCAQAPGGPWLVRQS